MGKHMSVAHRLLHSTEIDIDNSYPLFDSDESYIQHTGIDGYLFMKSMQYDILQMLPLASIFVFAMLGYGTMPNGQSVLSTELTTF